MTPSNGHAAASAAQPRETAPGRRTVLLEKLVAAIRPEFRTDEILFDADDPVFGGSLCVVGGCERTRRARGLCHAHYQRWRDNGRPDVEGFAATVEKRNCWQQPARHEQYVLLDRLPRQVKLEVQYVLQRRRDDGHPQTYPNTAQRMVHALVASGVGSLLDLTETAWSQQLTGQRNPVRALLIYARSQVEDLHNGGRNWEIEYARDVWRLRQLGVDGQQSSVRFDRIAQPWLKDLAKRWIRWQIAAGARTDTAYRGVRAITRFALFLDSPTVTVDGLIQVDRDLLERYLVVLRGEFAGSADHRTFIGSLNAFFQAIRQHRWDDTLPSTAVFFTDDHPKPTGQRLPRAVSEQIMAQIEDPANLDRWNNTALRLVTLILIRCGLRISDALRLPRDCLVRDADTAPYLRYVNHKMKREALVPIDDELERDIRDQQDHVLGRYPDGTSVLFPQAKANPDGRKAMRDTTYRRSLYGWLQRCDIRDGHGQPIKLVPHQWRHTLGTRLINRDVPQEVVRKILDHDSHTMTAHYARLSDTTVRRHWEQARKVNITGDTVTFDPNGPLAEAAWAKQRLSRATQALPNGYCGLPLVQSCPHANSCLTCPMFLTTAEFLPQHRQHHQQTLQIISTAEARGQARMAEMNRQVANNLEKIITVLDADNGDQQQVADAC